MNKNILNIEGSASISLMEKAKELKEKGIMVTDLAGGEPNFDTPECIRSEAIRSLEAGHTHYTVGKGIPELRKRIANKLKNENNIWCTEDQIIVTPGAKFAIYMAIMTLVNPGDEVIVLAPYWVSYIPIIQLCGATPIVVQLDYKKDYKIEKDKILNAITKKTKLLILNYPNNPTGRVLHEEEANILKEIVLKNKLYVISDEIYERIVYDNKKSISLASIREIADRVITVNGFSKSVAMTGWRIGYVVASKSIIESMYKIFVHSMTGVCTFVQEAAIQAFECEHDIQNMCFEYQKRRDYMVSELQSILGVHCSKPEGAFYLWIRFDTNQSAKKLCKELIEKYHLLVVPGNVYGEENAVYIRSCFATSEKDLHDAIKKLRSYMSDNEPKVV